MKTELMELTGKRYGKLNDIKLDRNENATFDTVTFTFYEVIERDDTNKIKKTADLATFECQVSELPDDMKNKLICHGIQAKLGDTQAKNSNIPISWCLDELDKMWKQLVEGQWTARKSERVTAKAVTAEKLGSIALPEGMDIEAATTLLKQLGLYKG